MNFPTTLNPQNLPASVDTTQSAPWFSVRWGRMLILFMRFTAVFWLIKGILSWTVIFGGFGDFEARSMTFQSMIIYFGVLDLVAAVGLWLLSTWGGVVWLLAVMSHIILAIFFPKIIGLSVTGMSAHITLVFAYVTISWLASREEKV